MGEAVMQHGCSGTSCVGAIAGGVASWLQDQVIDRPVRDVFSAIFMLSLLSLCNRPEDHINQYAWPIARREAGTRELFFLRH